MPWSHSAGAPCADSPEQLAAPDLPPEATLVDLSRVLGAKTRDNSTGVAQDRADRREVGALEGAPGAVMPWRASSIAADRTKPSCAACAA